MPSLHSRRSALVLAVALSAIPAVAQQPRPNQLPPPGPAQAQPQAPIKPYQALAIKMPTPSSDASFTAFRKQLADIARRKDRNALAKVVVAQGFFWESESGDKADKQKNAVANLEQAIGGFSGPDAQGWDVLAQAAEDPTIEPLPDHAGVMCGPAGPEIDGKAFEALVKATGTEPGDWAFPIGPNLEVRNAAQPNAPVIEKLGLHLLRVLAEEPPANAQAAPTFIRIVTPSGNAGYVALERISPIGFDQLCYRKDASGWKIAGFAAAE
jgi:hypothetical protein